MAYRQFFAHMQSPIQRACDVGDAQNNWMGVVINFVARQGGECCAIVYYDCDVFEAIDGYEILVQIVLEMEKSPLNNFFWKIKVPPKF